MRATVPASLAPYDSVSTGPNQSIMARFTSGGHAEPVWETCRRLETSYRARTSAGRASSRWKWVGTITVEETRHFCTRLRNDSASYLPRTTTG